MIAILDLTQRQHGTYLGQRLNHQHARHHRRTRKVALEERFVDADLFDSDYPFLRDQLDNSIDQKKRIAMRQEFLNCQGIEDCFHYGHCQLAIASWQLAISLLWRGRRRCGRRILAVEVRDERASDVGALLEVKQRHSGAIDNYVDATRFGKHFKHGADFKLQRLEEFIAALVVSGLGVFSPALNILLQLFELIDFDL